MNPKLILENDMHPENVRLARMVKKMGGEVGCVQTTLIANSEESAYWVDVINENTKLPSWMPFKREVIRIRKWIGHIIKYRTLKAGESSYILRRGCSGLRDCDFQTYLCEEQKKLFLKNGVPENKLLYNPYFTEKPKKKTKKIITILVPSENDGGVDRYTGEFIPFQKQLQRWITIFAKIYDEYPDYKFFIKLHPNTKKPATISKYLYGIRGPKNVKCFYGGKKEADYCIDQASIIIGLPPSFSTLLYQASVEYPWKTIISLDVGNEMFGDYFKGYKNIIYETDITKINRHRKQPIRHKVSRDNMASEKEWWRYETSPQGEAR